MNITPKLYITKDGNVYKISFTLRNDKHISYSRFFSKYKAYLMIRKYNTKEKYKIIYDFLNKEFVATNVFHNSLYFHVN